MENKKEFTDRSQIRMILESTDIIIKKMGNKNGSLIIDELSPLNVSAPLNFKDLFDATKVPTLVASFKIPDNKGNLITFHFSEGRKTIVKVRELDQKEIALYGHVIFKEFNSESNFSSLKYFYNVVTFVSCYVAYQNLLDDLVSLKKTYLGTKGKTELPVEIKNSTQNSFERKELELEKFNKEFSVYLTGNHLFEKL